VEPTYYTCTDQRCEQSAVELEIISRLQALDIPVVPQVKLGQNWVFDGVINGTRIIVEIHGDYWHTRPEVKERDSRKQAWAALEGYSILTIWEADYHKDPDGTLRQVLENYETVKALSGEEQPEGDKGNTPKPIPGSVYGDWRDRFLEVLSEGGLVVEACVAAGVSRKTAYQWQKRDPEFAEDWRLAKQDAADIAFITYRKRGIQQSDRAMEFFIKSRDPETFGQPGQLDLVLKYLDLSRLTNEQLDRIAGGEDPLSVLFSS
jgi:very-short-patch-repair endonuclease